MSGTLPTDLLVIFLRLFLKALGIYLLFTLPINPNFTVIGTAAIILSEVYEVPALLIVRRNHQHRALIYTIVGMMNIFLIIALVYFMGYITGDLFLFIIAGVIGIGIAGGLFPSVFTSLLAGVIYLIISVNSGLEFDPASIRALFILLIGGIAGVVTEIYFRTQRDLYRLHEEKTHTQRDHRIKEKFITSASHNLRTPLTVMKGYIEILTQPNTSQDELKAATERLTQQITNFEALVEKLIRVANVETLTDELNLQTQRLDDLLKDLYAAHLPLAEQKNIRFEYQPDHPTDLHIEFDYDQMKTSLGNIVSNALKFTPEEGKVTIRTEDSQSQVHVLIQDSGPGIAAEDQENLFTLFYQGGNFADQKEGTGVGLFIAREIISAHGGTIEVESEINRGTLFDIALPKASVHRLFSEL